MKKVQIIEGVVAEYNGKYWGIQDYDTTGFGDIEKASISNPKYCRKPTDKTSKNCVSDFNDLSKAKLVSVKKTITTEIEIFQ